MTTYRDDTMSGTDGATVVAADIGLDYFVGLTPTYQPPGPGVQPNSTFYEATAGTQSYGVLEVEMGDIVYHTIAMQLSQEPNVPTKLIRYGNSTTGDPICSLSINPDGNLEATGQTETPDSPYNRTTKNGGYAASNWIWILCEINRGRNWVYWHFFDRELVPLETIALPHLGDDVIDEYWEGIIDLDADGFGVNFSKSFIRTEPQWIGNGLQTQPNGEETRDNIFYCWLDDADPSLIDHVEEAKRWGDNGTRFLGHFCNSPQCAPSRAALMSGRHPQNNGVLANSQGMEIWHADDRPENEATSIFAELKKAGYRVCVAGKFTNNYDTDGGNNPAYPSNFFPQGIDWGMFGGEGSAYAQFWYKVSHTRDGVGDVINTTSDGPLASNYLTDRTNEFVLDFIQDCKDNHPTKPWFVYYAPYVSHANIGDDPDPHAQMSDGCPPAPRDRAHSSSEPAAWHALHEFPTTGDMGVHDFQWPDYRPYPEQSYNWNVRAPRKPLWERDTVLDSTDLADNQNFQQNKVKACQSVNDGLVALDELLDDLNMTNKTWRMFSSDNGYRLGQRGIKNRGKNSALDIDTRLPLHVMPPGGSTPQTVGMEFPTQSIDVMPTCLEIANWPVPDHCDGGSFKSMVEGVFPAVWRKTVLLSYTDLQSTKEELVDTDDVPTWVAIRTAGAHYTTYEEDLNQAPEVGWGEAYDVVADPGMMDNLYEDLPAYRKSLAQQFVSTYYQAQGQDSWEQGLREFFLTGGTGSIDGPTYTLGETEQAMTDPYGRWCEVEATTLPAFPGISTTELNQYNVDDAPEYDTVGDVTPTYLNLVQVAKAVDELGNKGDARQLRANVNAMTQFTSPPGRIFTLGQRPAVGSGVEWITRARVTAGYTPQRLGNRARKVERLAEIPSGDWYSLDLTDWTLDWYGGIPNKGVDVPILAGSTAPVRGLLIRIEGPIDGIESFTDPVTGWAWSWDPEAPDVLVEGTCLLVNTRTGVGVRKENIDWDFTTGDPLDQTARIDSNTDHPELWRMTPYEYEGESMDMRCRFQVVGLGGKGPSTKISIRGRRFKYH